MDPQVVDAYRNVLSRISKMMSTDLRGVRTRGEYLQHDPSRSARLIKSHEDAFGAAEGREAREVSWVMRTSSAWPTDFDGGPCRTPFAEMRRIPLNELELATVSSGKYVVARVCSRLIVMTSVQFIVKDSIGEVERIAIYNHHLFQGVRTNAEASKVLPVDSILVLKEPHFKFAADGDFTVRVDTPVNCLFLPHTLTLQQAEADLAASALSLQRCSFYVSEGNCYYQKKLYGRALDCFSMAMKCPECPWQVHVNRSALQLKYGRPYEAYCDARAAVEKEGSRPVCLLRACDAAIACRFYHSAHEFRLKYLQQAGEDVEGDELLKEIKQSVEEAASGRYKYGLGRHKAASKRRTLPGDYVGPIALTEIPGKGKGVVTTRDVEEGELLLCSQPIICASSNNENRKGLELSTTGFLQADMNDSAELRFKTLVAASSDRLYRFWLSTLWSGSERKRPNVTFDTFKDLEDEGVPEVEALMPADVSSICRLNRFGSDNSKRSTAEMYLHLSFFNHSCVANTHLDSSHGCAIVHAIRPLAKGTEVTLSYIDPRKPHSERAKVLEAYGFTCKCQLCEDQRRMF